MLTVPWAALWLLAQAGMHGQARGCALVPLRQPACHSWTCRPCSGSASLHPTVWGTNPPPMSRCVLVTVSPFNPALMPTDFSLVDGAGGFMAERKPAAGLRPSRSLNQALPAPREGVTHDQRAARGSGEKSALQEDVPGPLQGEDLDAFLWKMVAVGNLQSQGFAQTEQAPPQPNKRACFWKYCVTK
ncbi:uncharacterized protein ACIB01_012094 isoform 1-T1 [Guaruba guarouba]